MFAFFCSPPPPGVASMGNAYSRSHDHTQGIKLSNLPGGWLSLFWTVDPRGGIPPSKSQIWLLEELFTLLDLRAENKICVRTISTIAICQNCSISFLAAPGVPKTNLHIWPTPGIIMTCRVCVWDLVLGSHQCLDTLATLQCKLIPR